MFDSSTKISRYCWAGLGVVLSLCFAGCAMEQGDDEPIVPEQKTAWQQLSAPHSFEIASTQVDGGSIARARGTVNRNAAPETTDVDLDILGGDVTLWATPEGYLVVSRLRVDLADVELGPDIVSPNGVALTGLQARVEFPAVAIPDSTGDNVTAVVDLDLVLEWAIKRDDGVYPMSPVRLDGVPVSIEVHRNADDTLSARFVALREGVFWSWANTFELSELMVHLVTPGNVVR